MTKETKRREAKLRRDASKKGLFIEKRKWKLYQDSNHYETLDGYCIGIEEIGLIAWGGDTNGMFLPTLEEAESIVADF